MDDRKRAEIEYPERQDDDGRDWLETKPYRREPASTARHLLDLAAVITLLDIRPGTRVLELGCGPGWLSIFLARCGADVLGTDISPGMIDVARRAADREASSARFEVADMEMLEVGRNFDACVIYEALHHTPEPALVLRSARRALRPGGQLLLVEPNWMHRFFGREATQRFGTTELGYSTFHLKRLLRREGFTHLRRFHSNRRIRYMDRPILYGNSPGDVLAHLAEPWIYRIFAPFWAQIFIRATAP
jgi:2-polyprenyl-3-methyl-5-hydroxy-6-metoxy-1,4-benzoquinol methylase